MSHKLDRRASPNLVLVDELSGGLKRRYKCCGTKCPEREIVLVTAIAGENSAYVVRWIIAGQPNEILQLSLLEQSLGFFLAASRLDSPKKIVKRPILQWTVHAERFGRCEVDGKRFEEEQLPLHLGYDLLRNTESAAFITGLLSKSLRLVLLHEFSEKAKEIGAKLLSRDSFCWGFF